MNNSDIFARAKPGDLFSELSPQQKLQADVLGEIAVAIHRRRQQLGMTQTELAEFCDVSQGMVSRWESGDYNFTALKLAEIFRKLNIPYLVPPSALQANSRIVSGNTAGWNGSSTPRSAWRTAEKTDPSFRNHYSIPTV